MKLRATLMVLCALAPSITMADAYSLENYLKTVQVNYLEYKSAALSQQASLMQENSEANLLTAPAFFAQISHTGDEKELPQFGKMYSKMSFTQGTVGIQWQTQFGLQTKLSYSLQNYTFQDMSIASARPVIYDTVPAFEFTQSLLRNGNGAEVRAQQEVIKSQNKMKRLSETMTLKQVLLESELAYWRVAAAQKSLSIAKENVERAEKIMSWGKRRANYGLTDQSDVFQSQALLEVRRLELQGAIDELKLAQRVADAYLFGSNTVLEMPENMLEEAIKSAQTIKVSESDHREDTLMAIENAKLAEASAILTGQKAQSNLDLMGSIQFDGREIELSKALQKPLSLTKPTFTIGLKYTMSLDGSALSDLNKASQKQIESAQFNQQQRLRDERLVLLNLNQQIEDANRRLILATKLEATQRQKWAYESERQQKGRSTLYQVLMFEQDYASAQAAKTQAQVAVLRLMAQLKTYGSVSQ